MNLQAFIRRVLEIQRAKDSQTLGYEELQEIALALGISQKDFESAKAASFMRGKGHLNHQNWDESIQEFQKVLILHPNHIAALFGLAKAHGGRWRRKRRLSDKRLALHYAQLCLEVDPSYQEAYQLVAQINHKKIAHLVAATPLLESKQKAQPAKFFPTWSLLMAFAICLVIITSFYQSPNDLLEGAFAESETTFGQVTSIVGAVGEKGPIVWVISYEQYLGQDQIQRSYQADIIDPIHNITLKTIPITTGGQKGLAHWDNPRFYNGNFYYYSEEQKDFQARDIYTGRVVENKALLSRRYPELYDGIAEVHEAQDWFELVLHNGRRFWYNPQTKALASEQEKLSSQGDYRYKKAWVDAYRWYQNQDHLDKVFYLFRKKISPYRVNNWQFVSTVQEPILNHSQSSANWYGDLIMHTEKHRLLNGFMIYGDEELCIIKHKSELADYTRLSCINTQGEKLWEINQPNSQLIKAIQARNLGSYSIQRFDNQLIISNPWLMLEQHNYPFCGALDLQTGMIDWEYSPTYSEAN